MEFNCLIKAKGDLTEFKKRILEFEIPDPDLIIDALYPAPYDDYQINYASEKSNKFFIKYDCDSVVTWKKKNWGCVIYEQVHIHEDTPNLFTFSILTEGNTPARFLKNLSLVFKDISFELDYTCDEADVGEAINIKNGVLESVDNELVNMADGEEVYFDTTTYTWKYKSDNKTCLSIDIKLKIKRK